VVGRGFALNENLSVVVIGAGAIGSSVAGWVSPKYGNLFLLTRGESTEIIRKQGLKFYLKGQQDNAVQIPIKIIESLSEISPPDIVIITVKNYDLESTATLLKEQLKGHAPIIVALENGVENQQILPKYFTKIIYGVICFNAWRDAPGKVGHQKTGYLILGTPRNDLQAEQQHVAAILRSGMDCTLTNRLEDAVHCKLVINLVNALASLVGFQQESMTSFDDFSHTITKLMWEGIQVVKANGFKEHKLGKIPSWGTIQMGAILPTLVTSFLYKFISQEEVGLNSTAQDLLAGKTTTELESLNGYMLKLAKKVRIAMPINQAIYEIAKERVGPNFQPMNRKELLSEIHKRLK